MKSDHRWKRRSKPSKPGYWRPRSASERWVSPPVFPDRFLWGEPSSSQRDRNNHRRPIPRARYPRQFGLRRPPSGPLSELIVRFPPGEPVLAGLAGHMRRVEHRGPPDTELLPEARIRGPGILEPP